MAATGNGSSSKATLAAYGLEPDPLIEAYKTGVDVTLLRENLKRTPTERVERLMALQRLAMEAKRAGIEARRRRGRSGA
jgi:hypothetical protein